MMTVAIKITLALMLFAISFLFFSLYEMHWLYAAVLILWGLSEVAYRFIKPKN